ncbi:GNAT family protein [Lentibacillus sp. N15]|uniref:GNAT family N-acetyltransferase n=1 Tax=Lentibacillus songyuanensis TaxID=3136161 RepID=UPI0031BB7DC3
MATYLHPTPWDKRNFHIDTYEVTSLSEKALRETDQYDGHYTIKVDPTANTQQLYNYGFYYMDTMIEPVCDKDHLQIISREGISISKEYHKEDVLAVAEQVFENSRFHRDFNIPSSMADRRYMNWVRDLQEKDLIIALYDQGELAGFFGYEVDKVLLLGMKAAYQGKGLTKAFTSLCCQAHFDLGYEQLRTSISAANLASLNLFIRLGFKLQQTIDVYHKLTGPAPVER